MIAYHLGKKTPQSGGDCSPWTLAAQQREGLMGLAYPWHPGPIFRSQSHLSPRSQVSWVHGGELEEKTKPTVVWKEMNWEPQAL